ncbi:MAG: hypothetical protein AAGA27_06220 [Pseudomonadota bacterium]
MKKTLFIIMLSTVAFGAVFAKSSTPVFKAQDYQTFSKQFCGASSKQAAIFALPSAIFTHHNNVDCGKLGVYSLRANELSSDPGHIIYNIDPPKHAKQGFDCDGKADIGMKIIAINCYPVNLISADHHRP